MVFCVSMVRASWLLTAHVALRGFDVCNNCSSYSAPPLLQPGFEAAFVLTSFRSLLTGPAASAQTYFATVRIWHAAAAPAAAVKGFFHHGLLAERAAASEYEVVIQPAVAASAAAKDHDGCLSDLAKHVFELVLRFLWSLVCAFGLCAIIDSGFGAVLSSVLRAVPGIDRPLSHGKGKNQSFKLKTT